VNQLVGSFDSSILNIDTMPQIVLIGCVAGLSQAFNTPIGSLLFVLEEFDFVRRSHITFVMIVACSVPATVISLQLKHIFGLPSSFLALPAPERLEDPNISLVILYGMAVIIGLFSGWAAEVS
jgi:H+/Cl- antiporter ClcA